MAKSKTYDPACYDLAERFLQDVPGARERHRDALAAEIQQTIEDYIGFKCGWEQMLAAAPSPTDQQREST